MDLLQIVHVMKTLDSTYKFNVLGGTVTLGGDVVPSEVSQELATLRATNAALYAALKDLQAWANMDYSTNPTTISIRENVKAAIATVEREVSIR